MPAVDVTPGHSAVRRPRSASGGPSAGDGRARATALHRMALLSALLTLASCASQPSWTSAGGHGATPQNSPECLAARLRPVDPMPVSAIPQDVLHRGQSGWVAVGYDVVAGMARNVKVVASEPPGLYDAYVLRHASAYTDPGGATVRGCVMTTHIRF